MKVASICILEICLLAGCPRLVAADGDDPGEKAGSYAKLPPEAREFLAALEKAYDSLTSYEHELESSTESDLPDAALRVPGFSGRLSFARPGKFRDELTIKIPHLPDNILSTEESQEETKLFISSDGETCLVRREGIDRRHAVFPVGEGKVLQALGGAHPFEDGPLFVFPTPHTRLLYPGSQEGLSPRLGEPCECAVTAEGDGSTVLRMRWKEEGGERHEDFTCVLAIDPETKLLSRLEMKGVVSGGSGADERLDKELPSVIWKISLTYRFVNVRVNKPVADGAFAVGAPEKSQTDDVRDVLSFPFRSAARKTEGKSLRNLTLEDISGKKISLHEFRGKILLLVVGNPDHGEFRRALAALDAMYPRLAAEGVGVVFAALSNAAHMKSVREELGITMPLYVWQAPDNSPAPGQPAPGAFEGQVDALRCIVANKDGIVVYDRGRSFYVSEVREELRKLGVKLDEQKK